MRKAFIGLSILLAYQIACPTFAYAFNKEKGTYTIDSSGVVIGKDKTPKLEKPKVEKPKKEKKKKK